MRGNTIVAVIAPFVEDVIAHQQGRKQFTPEVIQTIFEREDIHYFVAELEQEIVGAVAYLEPAHLMHFFLIKALHGQGYGTVMWNFIEAKIKRQSVHSITVNSSFYAQPIYEKFGFVVIGCAMEKKEIHFIPMIKAYGCEAT